MKPSRLPFLLLATLLACGTKPPPPPAAPPPPKTWTWHRMGDYIAIDGEVDHATHLTIIGPSTHVSTAADFGPVHWELRSPVLGEPVALKDADGKVLAEWVLKGKSSDEAPPWMAPAHSTAKATRLVKVQPPAPAHREVVKVAPPPPKSVLPPHPFTPAPTSMATGTWPGAGEALDLRRGPRNQKVILLSFDGGSSNEAADEILSTLESRHVRTTIFLTGAFIERFPDVVRRIVADGHEVGNHTFDHPHFAPDMRRDLKWSQGRVQDELLRADEAFYHLTGRPMDPLWRSPYGEQTREIRAWAESIGYRHVGWSDGADSLDWATPNEHRLYRSGDAILDKLHARLEKDGGGLIVLMHLGSGRPESDRPAAKLGAFIDQARKEGWRFVTATEMLRLMGQPAWDRSHRLALLRSGSTSTAGGR